MGTHLGCCVVAQEPPSGPRVLGLVHRVPGLVPRVLGVVQGRHYSPPGSGWLGYKRRAGTLWGWGMRAWEPSPAPHAPHGQHSPGPMVVDRTPGRTPTGVRTAGLSTPCPLRTRPHRTSVQSRYANASCRCLGTATVHPQCKAPRHPLPDAQGWCHVVPVAGAHALDMCRPQSCPPPQDTHQTSYAQATHLTAETRQIGPVPHHPGWLDNGGKYE
mmetsp:Transcript_30430/g.54660  ORF Transcript_30430/g.54660 Transcript_30430/m.54660 type:complete len:215 (+) Transcript_30430:157-801(+)